MSEDSGNGEEAIRKAVESAENVDAAGNDDGLDLRLSKLPRNDSGNAQRLIARFGRDLMYVHGPGWFAWDGKRWREDPSPVKGKPGLRAMVMAQKTAELILDEAKAAANDPATIKRFGDEKQYEKFLGDLRNHSRQSGNEKQASSMVSMAAPYLARHIDELDTHDYLFNVANGTLDLSGERIVLRKHCREDRLTHLADIDYDPSATRPLFNQFLDVIMPSDQMQTFLQRYFGYCLTGSTREQKLIFCAGRGGNGKSTLNNILRVAFGSYAVGLPFESVLIDENRRGKEASPDIARLPGVRLVIAAEPEKGVQLSTATIKRFTGGEPITVRKNFGDFFEFKYRFKLSLSFNDKPRVPAQDDGTWDRPLLVEFKRRVRDKMVRDPDIDAKLAPEASGVLNWLLDGYLEWREKGLEPPEEVISATAQYRAENDPLGQFLNQGVERIEGESLRGDKFYEAYKAWSERSGHRPMSLTLFGRSLPERGYTKNDKSGYVIYENVRLRAGPDDVQRSTWIGGESDETIDY